MNELATEAKVTLTLEKGDVGVIKIHNGDHNILSAEVLREFEQVFDEAVKKSRVIVLTTEGDKVFIAGADVNEILNSTYEEISEMIADGHEMFFKVERSPVPVIAVIDGICMGGGTELALACHMRFAAKTAKIALPEIRLGIMPGLGGTFRLVRAVGRARAYEMLLTGEPVSADEAANMGLVNKVARDSKGALRDAMTLAKRIAQKSKVSVRHIMEMCVDQDNRILSIEAAREASRFKKSKLSQDGQEGIQAFVEKRSPKFEDK
jgi:enoyl-CoA hydratase